MPHLPKLARLEELKRALETAVRMTKEPAVGQTLMGLAAQDPERWNFVLDSLSAGMEPGEMGSIQQVLTALSAAMRTDDGPRYRSTAFSSDAAMASMPATAAGPPVTAPFRIDNASPPPRY